MIATVGVAKRRLQGSGLQKAWALSPHRWSGLAGLVAAVIGLGVFPPRTHANPGQLASPSPTVVVHAISDRERIARGDTVDVAIMIENASGVSLHSLALAAPSKGFSASIPESLTETISPYSSIWTTLRIAPGPAAAFGGHRVPVLASYVWNDNGKSIRSAQVGEFPLQVVRFLDDEGSSLPGGSAVFLYMLLPVLPAFVVFKLLERRRRREPFEMPKLGTDEIVPAMLFSILLGAVFVSLRTFNIELARSSPMVFLAYVGFSAALGAVVPGCRLLAAKVLARRWDFRNTDDVSQYFERFLLRPHPRPDVPWVTYRLGTQSWQGFELKQMSGRSVLGAGFTLTLGSTVLASPTGNRQAVIDDATRLTQDMTKDNRRLLWEMVTTAQLNVELGQRMRRDDESLEDLVTTDLLPALTRKVSAALGPVIEVQG